MEREIPKTTFRAIVRHFRCTLAVARHALARRVIDVCGTSRIRAIVAVHQEECPVRSTYCLGVVCFTLHRHLTSRCVSVFWAKSCMLLVRERAPIRSKARNKRTRGGIKKSTVVLLGVMRVKAYGNGTYNP